ncbi:MAG: hypothetical protein PHY32_03575, partial [Candidatus Pacebacteria bacterium]|nr:hypothetical protein [Candidatus Paceibacterota bacterium]
QIRINDFYYYSDGGIVKIVRKSDDDFRGTLLKFPKITYDILIDPKKLVSKITDPNQINVLEKRIVDSTCGKTLSIVHIEIINL